MFCFHLVEQCSGVLAEVGEGGRGQKESPVLPYQGCSHGMVILDPGALPDCNDEGGLPAQPIGGVLPQKMHCGLATPPEKCIYTTRSA